MDWPKLGAFVRVRADDLRLPRGTLLRVTDLHAPDQINQRAPLVARQAGGCWVAGVPGVGGDEIWLPVTALVPAVPPKPEPPKTILGRCAKCEVVGGGYRGPDRVVRHAYLCLRHYRETLATCSECGYTLTPRDKRRCGWCNAPLREERAP